MSWVLRTACEICGKHRTPSISHAKCSKIRQKQLSKPDGKPAKPLSEKSINYLAKP